MGPPGLPNAAAPPGSAPAFLRRRATAVGPTEVRWRRGARGRWVTPGGGGVLRARRARKTKAWAGAKGPRPRLSKKWLAPLFRGVHSSLAPTARPGSYARKPLLRKAFCGFDAHVAKSDQSLRGLRPPNPRGFFDRLWGGGQRPRPYFVRAVRARRPPGNAGVLSSLPNKAPTSPPHFSPAKLARRSR